MNNNQIVTYNESLLQKFCSTHSKNPRSKRIEQDFYKQTVYNMAATLDLDFNCTPVFITITFPIQRINRDIKREWTEAGQFIENFKNKISTHHLIVGGVISVEPHKNNDLKSKRGKNTKAGAPHFHMVLWVTHKFLNPDQQKLSQYLLESGTYSKVSYLKTYMDTLKAVLYTTKEKGDTVVTQLAQNFFSWKNSINIWINHNETKSPFENISKTINLQNDCAFISYELYNTFPTTKKFQDQGLLLASIFSKVFAIKGLAVKDGNVYNRIEGTKFSWEKWIPLDSWVAQRFSFDQSSHFLEMLKNHASWIYSEGAQKKTDVPFALFPKLSILNFLVEFKDCVFEFSKGTIFTFDQIAPQTATVCFVDNTFDQCKPPYITLGLLHTLISWGKDISQERKDILQIPDNLLTKSDHGTISYFQDSQNRFTEALQTFGGLFHPTHNRKKNPALYLQGPPSTYKTFLIKTIFDKLVGLDSVEVLDRNSSRFNTANLRKQDEQPYVLIIDDLRWDHLGMHLPDFINLLDGYFVRTEQKYQKPQSGPLKGTIAVTSNDHIGGDTQTSDIAVNDRKALETRLKSVELYPIREVEDFIFTPQFLKTLEDEAVGFSILTNAVYLAKNKFTKNQLQLPKSFFQYDLKDEKTNLYEKAGITHLQELCKQFQEN